MKEMCLSQGGDIVQQKLPGRLKAGHGTLTPAVQVRILPRQLHGAKVQMDVCVIVCNEVAGSNPVGTAEVNIVS